MQQIMWETVFNREFEKILASHGSNLQDKDKVEALKRRLNFTRRASCQLMIEVDEHWKQRLNQILEDESLCCK